MTLYGAKVYGSFNYGTVAATDISVYPFTTRSLDYGSITLSWVYPTSANDFSTFMIVRNPLGFPVTPDNGNVIHKTDKTTLSSSNLLGSSYAVTDLGLFYDIESGSVVSNYSATSAVAAVNSYEILLTTNNANVAVGQAVTGNPGIIGGSRVTKVTTVNGLTLITLDKKANIPAGTSLTFLTTSLAPGKTYYYSAFVLSNGYWSRVGTATGICIKNYNTADFMYSSLPSIYTSSSNSSGYNIDLYNFLRVPALQYDLLKTRIENAKNRYDASYLDGKLIPALMDQHGFIYESSLGLQQARRLLQNSDSIYLNKGTKTGLKKYLSAYSGYGCSIPDSKNLFLTLDCASFEAPLGSANTGFWSSIGMAFSIENEDSSNTEFSPYSEISSPDGYPNSSNGYLKVTCKSYDWNPYILSYGFSKDVYKISSAFGNDSFVGYQYVQFSTTEDHNFRVGQQVSIQGMESPTSPYYRVNGLFPIVQVNNTRSFTVYIENLTVSQPSIVPTGEYGYVRLYDPKLYGIPVSAGSSYIFSGYSAATTSTRPVVMGIKWYNKNGSYISSSSASTTNAKYTWTRAHSGKLTAPANSAFAVPYIQLTVNLGGTFPEVSYLDALQFEKTSASTPSTYTDPRRIDIYLTPNRINHVINPGFEIDTSNWTVSGASLASESTNVYPLSTSGLGSAVSTKSAKLTATATTAELTSSSAISVSSNYKYAFSAYIKAASGKKATLKITWKDSGGTTISTSSSALTSLTSSFKRVSVVDTSPSSAATAVVSIAIDGANTDIYYVDSILFEQDYVVNPYFDGSTGYFNTDDVMWEQNASKTAGTASTGRSLYYPNRLAVINRIKNTVNDFIPIGSNWALFIGTSST